MWICTNAACAKPFSVALPDLAVVYEKNDGDIRVIECPACKQKSGVRADKCAVCGTPVVYRSYVRPLCEKHKDDKGGGAAGGVAR